MRAAVTGATGFVGVPLCNELKRSGWEVTVLARNAASAEQALGSGYDIISWTPANEIPHEALRGVDTVINLAGESINGRWTEKRKKRILESRTSVTRRLVEAIGRMDNPPQALINASAIGYYGPRGDEKLCEDEHHGSDFQARVCKAWEEEAFKAERFGTWVVTIRIGVVLGDGGALSRMIIPFKMFAGGPVGNGKQWFSWVHRDDLIGIIKFAAQNHSLRGPVNATAPEPVTMGEFSKILGKVLNRPSWLPVPGFVLKAGLGEMSDMLLNGQRVIPRKALDAGYEFKYGSAEEALRNILG
ncbi:MAG: TIGR01777 family protein [Actinobacteria bacterium]|nr:TIGR01777 family protein [Actinomycetota bacterium]